MATGPTGRRLAAVVDDWTGRSVLVVGDAMLDEWRFADSERLCREAPAPVLTLRERIVAAGGAANTAVNLTALGARAALVAPIGADRPGDELRDCLDQAGVWDRTITEPDRRTPVKRRLLAADQILLREDEGDLDDVPPDEAVRRLLAAIACAVEELGTANGGQPPTLVVCDYGLGALTEPVRAWLVERRHLFGTVALDAHELARWSGLAPTVITPSFAEAVRLLATVATDGTGVEAGGVGAGAGVGAGVGVEIGDGFDGVLPVGEERAEFVRGFLAELRRRTGATVAAVTLDADGAVVGGSDGDGDGDGEPCRSHSTPVPASYAVGAGDAYLAAMTLALSVGAPLPEATRLAQLAATMTVAETGTCVCRREDLVAALGAATGDRGTPTVTDLTGLTALVERHRREGHTVVFTNGCFDVLHRGHVGYLRQARDLGDLLVVAVNSDDSVRRLKGADRPVNPVEDRVAVLAALACVDCVVIFEEDSPARLIEAVRPDIYVKGGDYPPELVPEAPLVRRLGGQVRTLGYVPDRSTSAIIERIRGQGAVETPTVPHP